MSATKRHALVTGASGLLGAALIEGWWPRWRLTATVNRNRIYREGLHLVDADLERPDSLAQVVVHERPDVVVHCGAWTDVDACEANPQRARTIHRDATAALARGADEVGAAFVYISTDAVFSDVDRLHTELDPVSPRSVYARTKHEGEDACVSACRNTLVVRTCIIGWNALSKTSLTEWIIGELREGRKVNAFADVCFTPILTTTLCEGLERLVAKGATGLVHAGGAECITKYAFAQRVADVFSLSRDLVVRGSIRSATLRAPRPESPCLDSSKFASLTEQPLQSVDEALAEMRRLDESGWRSRLHKLVARE